MAEGRGRWTRGRGRSPLRRVLFSPDEPRLRAGWRLAVHTLLVLALVAALGVIVAIVGGLRFQPDAPWTMAYATLPVAPGATLATWLARRFVDRRSFTSLGLALDGPAWRDLTAGLGLGAAMVGAIAVLMWALGWLAIDGWAWERDATPSAVANALGVAAFFVLVGYYEEFLSRGYHLVNLADGLGLGWAVLLTSISFSLLHLANPDAGPASVAGILAAGIFFAYARIRSGLLWLPIGVHITWNLTLGLLGFPVSGIRVWSLVSHRVTGPIWATGGAFGPEAGALTPLVLLAGGLVVWAATRNRPARHDV